MVLSSILLAAASTVLAAADSPFACNLAALTPAERKHHFDEVTPALRKQVKSVKELPDGYAFELPAKALPLAAEWVSRERLCCPFLGFALQLEPERGPFHVTLTGRPGTREFIREDFASWFR